MGRGFRMNLVIYRLPESGYPLKLHFQIPCVFPVFFLSNSKFSPYQFTWFVTITKEGVWLRNVSAAPICNHFTVVTPGCWIREVCLFLGLTIVAVIGVLMVPITSIFRSVPQNNTPSMTSSSLASSSVSHCQGNGHKEELTFLSHTPSLLLHTQNWLGRLIQF